MRGFSLIEIAIVLVIIAILITAVAVPLSTQIEQQRTSDTQRQLEQIREAIYGFAIANGRLPCPATNASNGVEAPPMTGACTVSSGFVPAATLGLSPLDSGGYAVDAWALTQNRLRYAVARLSTPVMPTNPATCTTTTTNILTTADAMKTAQMDCLSAATLPLLTVRSTIVNNVPAGCNPTDLTTKAPFVIFSLGKNATTGGIDADEAQNITANATTFVSHSPTAAGSCSGEFDDIVTWGNLNTLFARMVQAGRLP